MQPSKSQVNEVDLLDVVKRLRGHINNLDNSNLLATKLRQFDDPALTLMAERIAIEIDNVAASAANLLKHVENSQQYRDIVRRYRKPSKAEEASKDDGDEEAEA